MHQLRRGRSQLVEILTVERVDQVQFAALEAQHLDVAIGLDVQPNRIQIWQFASLPVRFPVIGIAFQQHGCSRLVVGHYKRSEHGRFFFRRAFERMAT